VKEMSFKSAVKGRGSEQNEVHGMKNGADYTGMVMYK